MAEEVSASSQESSENGLEEKKINDTDAMSTEKEDDSDQLKTDFPELTQIAKDTETEDEEASDNSSNHIKQFSDNEARLEQLEKEHETLRSQYMRIAADFDNFRKRQSRDQDDLRMQLTCNTLTSILPVVDNFERARQQLEPEGEEAQALHRSYQGLYKQLVEVLKQLGVAPMRVVGQGFDPSLHEAVLREPSEEHEEDIITEELQRGYHINGRVLRHALVKVSMGPGSNTSVESDLATESNQTSSIEDKEGTSQED